MNFFALTRRTVKVPGARHSATHRLLQPVARLEAAAVVVADEAEEAGPGTVRWWTPGRRCSRSRPTRSLLSSSRAEKNLKKLPLTKSGIRRPMLIRWLPGIAF